MPDSRAARMHLAAFLGDCYVAECQTCHPLPHDTILVGPRRADVLERSDRLVVEYTSMVPDEVRAAVLSAVRTTLAAFDLYRTEHFDRQRGAWSVDVTHYDPAAPRPVKDSQLFDYLKSVAKERGVSVDDLIRAAREL